MLAFVLFFASFVVPFVLIGGLLVLAARTPQVEPTARVFPNSFVAMPALATDRDRRGRGAHYGGALRVPSSSIPGRTWRVHLN
ncbi:MAG: hypothetical protein AAF089_15305 [Bacteroidota bacterium]